MLDIYTYKRLEKMSKSILITALLWSLSGNIFAMGPQLGIDLTVSPPTSEDFVPEIKVVLPKHLTYKSVKLTRVNEIRKGQLAMYQCYLEIMASTSEPLYSFKEFKEGKYHIQEVTPIGADAALAAMAMAMPSVDGLPNLRVILLPKDPNDKKSTPTGTPLSKYKPGSYVIVK